MAKEYGAAIACPPMELKGHAERTSSRLRVSAWPAGRSPLRRTSFCFLKPPRCKSCFPAFLSGISFVPLADFPWHQKTSTNLLGCEALYTVCEPINVEDRNEN